MILGILLTLMTLGAAALVVLPLIRAQRTSATRTEHEIEIYRDQLDEVGRDLERGQITTDQADAARIEISRRILAIGAPDAPSGGPSAETPGSKNSSSRLPAIVAGLAVPVVAAAVYFAHGKPDLPGVPSGGRQVAASPENPVADELQRRVADLAVALEKDPQELRNWIALGDALTALKRHDKAAISYRQAMRLAPDDADLASR
ncbi:MAG: c-type cytochrome biogenesis protein CcmI, partial [Proteobacteria bacterium]|nr:c-type cytochrome biogenesis protein CcmI [Pseudomonadota bacterium]